MHEPARTDWMSWFGPVVVLIAALALRAGYLVELTDRGRSPAPLQVQDARQESIVEEVRMARERGEYVSRAPWSETPEKTAFAAPGYPFFVLALSQLPGDLEPAVRWVQCVLGALTASFWCLLAGWLFRSHAVGFLAGLFCAVHPFWIVNIAEIDDGVLCSFLLALSLLVGTIGARSGGPFASLAFGLLLALLCLVRAALLPFAFVALLWYLWQCKRRSRSWITSVLVFLGFVNGLAPWAVHDYQLSRSIVPIVDSTFYHLWLGNNPLATGGPLPAEVQAKALADQKGESSERASREMYVMDENQRYESLAPYVYQEVRQDPGKTLARRLWAGLCFGIGQDLLENHGFASPGDCGDHWLVRAWPGIVAGTLLVMFGLALLGWRWSFGFARNTRLIALAVGCCFLPYCLSHGEALHGPRLPLDGVFLTFAAFAVFACTPGALGWLQRREGGKDLGT